MLEDERRWPRRRPVLRALASGSLAGLAGCIGLGTDQPRTITETTKLAPADGDPADLFGFSIALADTGDTALIGTPKDEHPNGKQAGAAYVFERTNGGWTEAAKLVPADGDDGDWFGRAVALADTGDTALVGAFVDEDPIGEEAGAAYVFERQTDGWSETAKFALTTGKTRKGFGYSVALADDGATALISDFGNKEATGTDGRAAYVFERTSGGWRETATLIPAHGTANDVFGQAVALKDDTALIGAPLDDHPDGEPTGAAFIFKRTSDGWTEAAKLTGANGDRNDYFGASVALTGDTALIGAKYDEDPNGERAGAAYVFERVHGGWTQTTKLTPAGGDARDVFGGSVALTDAGDTALIGAPGFGVNGTEESGMAYVFERNTTGWSEAAKLAPADINEGDEFGLSVALADSTLLVSAHQDADPNGAEAGTAYVFDL